LKVGIPVNDWFQLDSGELHVIYHIGFPGHRPFVTSNPVVTFFVGVFLVEATNVPKMDAFGKSDPFCKLKLSCDYEWAHSSTKDETFYPIWDQHFRFVTVDLANTQLEVQLWDTNPVSDKLIGSASIGLIEYQGNVADIDLLLKPAPRVNQAANVHFYLDICPIGGSGVFPEENFVHRPPRPRLKATGKKKGLRAGQIVTFDEGLTLFVHVISASDIRSMDWNGLSDPFVQLRLGDQKAETSVIRKTLSACWEEMFRFKVMSFPDDVLQLLLYDWDRLSRNDLIGTVRVRMCDLIPGRSAEYSWVLEPVELGKPSGVLSVELHLAKKGMIFFRSAPMVLDVIHVRLVSLTKFKSKDPVLIELQLANDHSWQNSIAKTESEEKRWDADFHFYLTPDIAPISHFRLISKGRKIDSTVSEGNVKLTGSPSNSI
jgi:hypothetical protein